MEHPLNLTSFFSPHIQETYLHVIMLFIAVLVIACLGFFVSTRLKNEIPRGSQNIFEYLVGGLYSLGGNIMGKDGIAYMPFVVGIGAYVIISNLMGLVPFLAAPTANMNTAAAPAICVFFLYNYIGIKKFGAGYIKHFLGPIPVLAPFMFIVELISHIARPLSLTMRLFGNIAGEDLVIAILFFLIPYIIVPLPMYFLAVFTATLQAFVFMVLTMVYIGGALEEAH